MPHAPKLGLGKGSPVAVIMAGGKGERFWPLSRQHHPKQFLRLAGTRTLLENTVARVSPDIPPERILVVTGSEHRDTVLDLLPDVPTDNVIVEPAARDTAACAGLAAMIVARSFGDPPVLLMPSDHTVSAVGEYLNIMSMAASLAVNTSGLVTIGIKPTHPHTGFGYIRVGEPLEPGYFKVDRFVEKPDRERAEHFLNKGGYLWNSGIFAWRPSIILREIERHMPELDACLQLVAAGGDWEDAYRNLPKKSMDYGIMEKAGEVYVIPGDFGWDDVGSWEALSRQGQDVQEFNAFEISQELVSNLVEDDPQAVLLDCKGCMVLPSERLVAGLGLEDLIIVDTNDAILILKRDCEQRVKELISELKSRGLVKYL